MRHRRSDFDQIKNNAIAQPREGGPGCLCLYVARYRPSTKMYGVTSLMLALFWQSLPTASAVNNLNCSAALGCAACSKVTGCGWCSDDNKAVPPRCERGSASGPSAIESACASDASSGWSFYDCCRSFDDSCSACVSGTGRGTCGLCAMRTRIVCLERAPIAAVASASAFSKQRSARGACRFGSNPSVRFSTAQEQCVYDEQERAISMMVGGALLVCALLAFCLCSSILLSGFLLSFAIVAWRRRRRGCCRKRDVSADVLEAEMVEYGRPPENLPTARRIISDAAQSEDMPVAVVIEEGRRRGGALEIRLD